MLFLKFMEIVVLYASPHLYRKRPVKVSEIMYNITLWYT